MARIVLAESKLKARRRRRRVIAVWCFAAGVLVLAALLVLASRLPFIRINVVEVVGTQAVDKTAVEQRTWQTITGSYFYLFSKQSALLYPKQGLIRRLMSEIPTVETVTVATQNRNTLVVSIVERQPAALWCGESVATSSPCFFVDQNGFAYALAPNYSGDAYQKYYGALSATSTTAGQFVPKDTFRSLTALVGALQKQIPLALETISVEKNNDLRIVFVGGFKLLVTLGTDNAATLERLSLALTAPVFDTHALRAFEYLDIRFGDKIYYKLKGE